MTMLDSVNLTQQMREFLSRPALEIPTATNNATDKGEELESIYAIASAKGLTLEDYVAVNPDKAVKTAQKIVADWENIQANAAITGAVNGVPCTREAIKLIEKAVSNARDDLDTVIWMANSGTPHELRRDRLIKVLYNKGIKGDVKAIQYYIDRIEGKIPDAKSQQLNYDNAMDVYKIVHTLFPKQLEVLNSGPGTRICCCGRRSGKTRLVAAVLLIEALRTDSTTCIYISKTMKMGEDGLLGPALEEIITACDLRETSTGKRLNWKHLLNGSQILVRGLSNTKDPDVIRGHKAKVVVIDEFFHMNTDLLDYLFNEVLKPMQLDYATEYKQILIGTPPRIRGTYGEKAWNTLDVPHFMWTAQDNPFIKNFDKFLEEECREKGVDLGHPYIRREYFGEWAYDEDALLYPEYKTWDINDVVPRLDIDRILCGLDYGTSDNDAIIGIAWSTRERRGFVFNEEKFNRLTTPKGMTQFEYLKKKVQDLWEFALDFWPNSTTNEEEIQQYLKEVNKRITWEADSSDGHLTEELQYNLRCKHKSLTLNIGTAHKTDKILMQDKIRDLFRRGDLLVQKGGKLEAELQMTVLKRDANGNILLDIDDKVYHPDLLHALRYAMWPAIGLEVING